MKAIHIISLIFLGLGPQTSISCASSGLANPSPQSDPPTRGTLVDPGRGLIAQADTSSSGTLKKHRKESPVREESLWSPNPRTEPPTKEDSPWAPAPQGFTPWHAKQAAQSALLSKLYADSEAFRARASTTTPPTQTEPGQDLEVCRNNMQQTNQKKPNNLARFLQGSWRDAANEPWNEE
jgi:hypothetical protein